MWTAPIAALAVLLFGGCSSVVWYGRSPDRRHRVEVIESGHRQRVQLDGRPGRAYQGLGIEGLAFSPDSRRLAYPARRADGSWVIVADGKEGDPWDGVGEVVFGQKGQLAYLARRGNSWHVIRDGKEVASARSIFRDTLVFGPTGRHLAWVIARGKRAQVVVDGKAGLIHDAIASLTFSPDGKRLGYAARTRRRWSVVIDEEPGPSFDHVAGLVLDRGGRAAYAAQRGQEAIVVVEGRPWSRPYDSVRASSLTFTSRGELVFAARRGAQARVVVGGKEGPPFDSVSTPVVSQLKGRIGYIGRRQGRHDVVLDGSVISSHREVGDLTLNLDGTRFAYLLGQGARVVVVHDRGRYSFDLVIPGTLVFSRDGQRLACVGGDRSKRKLFIAVNGRPAVALDLEEFNAHLMLPHRPDPHLLRRWVAAELARAAAR